MNFQRRKWTPVGTPNPELNEYIENPQNFLQYIKQKCVVCGKKIHNHWFFYKIYGNYCKKCSSDATEIKYTRKPTIKDIEKALTNIR